MSFKRGDLVRVVGGHVGFVTRVSAAAAHGSSYIAVQVYLPRVAFRGEQVARSVYIKDELEPYTGPRIGEPVMVRKRGPAGRPYDDRHAYDGGKWWADPLFGSVKPLLRSIPATMKVVP